MRVPFRLVDVFTDRPLAGNQLCVVPDAAGLSASLMQALAREIGFSETSFVVSAEPDRYAMRIFTPATEMPFAGHPTLGTAFVLASEGRVRSPATQVVPAGEFGVDVDVGNGWARMHQHPPEIGSPLEGGDLEAIAQAVALGRGHLDADLPPRVIATGIPHLIVAAASDVAVSEAQPDLRRLSALLTRLGADGLYLFHLEGDRAHARLFAPGLGVNEDAATGSAAGPLGVYVFEHVARDMSPLTVHQGAELGRPSTLVVEAGRDDGGWRVVVGGGVVVVGEGVFRLPPSVTGAA